MSRADLLLRKYSADKSYSQRSELPHHLLSNFRSELYRETNY